MNTPEIDTAVGSMAATLAAMFPEEGEVDWPNRLKELRSAKRLTLAVASKAVGMSLGYLSQIERGKHKPSLAMAFRLAHFYGVKVDDIWARVQP